MNGRLVERSALGEAERAAMAALMDRHFLGVTRDVFERDLAGKDHAILLSDDRGRLTGFTTLALERVDAAGETMWALHSGDTIVERSARGSAALARTWIHSVRTLQAACGAERLVWLLICSGHRTYRFLPVFFHAFYPRFDRPTPEPIRQLMEALARRRYGRAFDAARGVVRLESPQPLRPEMAWSPGQGADSHMRFFEQRNPGHLRGDELVCFADLDDANLTAAGHRMVRAGARARGAGRIAKGSTDGRPVDSREVAV